MSVSASKASQEQWSMFCDTLKQSGLAILQSSETQDEVTQAEGLRYLTRILRAEIERFVENWDPLDPYMAPTYNDRLKWGMDNPDSIYRSEEHTSELQSLMRISYAVFCLKKQMSRTEQSNINTPNHAATHTPYEQH